MGLLINEEVNHLYSIWGQPVQRNYSTPERLYYVSKNFRGSFLIYKNRILSIRYELNKYYSQARPFITALGLKYEDIKNLNKKDLINFILKKYQYPPHLKTKNILNLYSRGISFTFTKKKLIYIEIFQPPRRD